MTGIERKLGRSWWVNRMREAEPLLRAERAKRLQRMTHDESLALFKALCVAGHLPPEPERRRIEATRMQAGLRIRQALNHMGGSK